MNVGTALERAANLIEERGHTRTRYQTSSGRLCVMGALATAVDGFVAGPRQFRGPTVAASNYLALFVGIKAPNANSIDWWNLWHCKKTVIATMRAAALDWRMREAQHRLLVEADSCNK